MQIECGLVFLNTEANRQLIKDAFNIKIASLHYPSAIRATHLLIYLDNYNRIRLEPISNLDVYTEYFDKHTYKLTNCTDVSYYQELINLGIPAQDAFRQLFISSTSFD